MALHGSVAAHVKDIWEAVVPIACQARACQLLARIAVRILFCNATTHQVP